MTDKGIHRGSLPVESSYIQESNKDEPAVVEDYKYDVVWYEYKLKTAGVVGGF